MNSFFRIAVGTLALGAAFLANSQSIYNPTRSVKDQGLTLKSWGSGTIAETDETAFEGTTSIRVSSRNYFQGGIVNFANPVDLSAAYADKNNLLQFTLNVPKSATTNVNNTGNKGNTGGGGKAGVTGGSTAGGADAGGGGARGGGRGGVTGGGGDQPAGVTLTTTRSLETVRLVISTTDGKKSEAFIDVKDKIADARGWIKAGIPLQAIAGFDKTNKIVDSIALAGDTVASFYMGEANILNDSTPVYGELNEGNLNLALGDEKTFIASGYGGSSPLKFDWDFDATDGIQVDATGQVVKRKFRKPGKYVITLTVSDVYGLKKPHTTTIEVEVNP
jgi:PKD domain